MYTTFLVRKYASTGDGTWSGTNVDVVDVYDVQVSTSLGKTKDTFSFKVNNPGSKNIWLFKPKDKVEIYYIINGATPDIGNLLMVGMIKNVSEELTSKNKVLRIEGASFSEIVTNALVFFDSANRDMTAFEIIDACRESVELRNTGFNVDWDSTNPTQKYVLNDNSYSGGVFPDVATSSLVIKEYDKSLASILDKYTKAKYTGDGDYYWFVVPDTSSTNKNKLVIRKRNVGASNGTWIEGSSFKTAKFSVNGDDVKNFIVVKCGLDLNNNPISTRYDDPVSRAKHGFRYHIIVDATIAQRILSANSVITNEELRRQAIEEGRAIGERYANSHNKGYLTVSVTTNPTVSFGLGDRINLTVASYANFNDSKNTDSIVNYAMRITGVRYDVYSVLFTLEEEVATV